MKLPAIVAPGGSFTKATIALDFGADSVYVAGHQFSLRKSADNLTIQQLAQLCEIAHKKNKAVYLALNVFPLQEEIAALIRWLKQVSYLPLNALIISDIGVCKLAREYTNIPIHTSTQASVTNGHAADMWKAMGAKRIVLARECSIHEARVIKQRVGIEIEMFIHGAMCSSFSGKCTISSVTSGRDSNRGGCVQSCRHQYKLETGDTLHVMNSKDLMGIGAIAEMVESGIDAVKIEGRMKSAYYVANTVQVIRTAINAYQKSPSEFHQQCPVFEQQLARVSNRGFTTASLHQPATAESISYDWNGYQATTQFLGIVKQAKKNRSLIHVRHPFDVTDQLHVLQPNRAPSTVLSPIFSTILGPRTTNIQANQLVWLHQSLPVNSIIYA